MNPLRCIVAGVGELAGDDPTLLLAVDLARRCGAKLHLVHVFQFPQLYTMSPGLNMVDPEGLQEYGSEIQALLEAAVRRNPEVDGEEVVCHALPGAPGQGLVDTADRLHPTCWWWERRGLRDGIIPSWAPRRSGRCAGPACPCWWRAPRSTAGRSAYCWPPTCRS